MPPPGGKIGHHDILVIALPIIASNVTQPLIGVIDTAILGQLDQPHLVGAVALGATIFAMTYFLFSFLRMGTTGLTAQADGAEDQTRIAAVFWQAFMIAVGIGTALVALQVPIAWLAMTLLQGTQAVEKAAETYVSIRIWSAPFALTNFAVLGWLIGVRRTGLAVALQFLLNGLNVVFSVALVQGIGLNIDGVAYGTLAAEVIAAMVGVSLVVREMRARGTLADVPTIFAPNALRRIMSVNRDIMLRSIALNFAFAFFVNEGARGGETTLAANAVLMHFLLTTAHVLDAFAYAAEALSGHAVGARRLDRFTNAVRLSTLWAFAIAGLLSMLCWLAGPTIIDALVVTPEIREAARVFLPWAALTPIVGVACFQLDGIFIGATLTEEMRNATALAVVIYLATWAILAPAFGNHGLWASIHVLFIARALTLGAYYPRLLRAFEATRQTGKA
ncbi:MAG: MATE family efflux transporter [Pseudomonadota bacterium]